MFQEEYCSKPTSQRKEFLSWFLNEDKDCVLYEQLRSWIDDTLDIIIPGAPIDFIQCLHRSIDLDEFREVIFNFIEREEGQ